MQKNARKTEQKAVPAHLTDQETVVGPDHDTLPQDDASVAMRLRRGDRSAAEMLVDRYFERIYLFMRAVGHDRQISEDLTQETFLRAWSHIGQLRDGKALSGWLFRIASNVSRLHRRRHRDHWIGAVDDMELPAGGGDGLHRAGDREQLDRLESAVAGLPWKLRQAIVLHYVDQLTIAEAAEAAGVRQGTLKSRLSRGLEALRKEMPGD